MMVYLSQIALYAYTFAFSRYAISLFFLRYIVLGIGLSVIYETIKEILNAKKLFGKNINLKNS